MQQLTSCFKISAARKQPCVASNKICPKVPTSYRVPNFSFYHPHSKVAGR